MKIPARSDQVELVECGDVPIRYNYRLTLIKRMSQVVALSNKVSLRVDYRGVLDVSVPLYFVQLSSSHLAYQF